MPTMISAVHGTGNIQSERKIVDMQDTIAYLEPDSAPLTVVLKRATGKSLATQNPKFSMLEAPIQPAWDAVNNTGGYDEDDTGIIVDNGSYFRANDLFKVPRTGEVIKITSISSNTLTVVRAMGTTVGAALVDNDPLLLIGNVHEEGATLGAIRTVKLEVFYNYTQLLGSFARNRKMRSWLIAGITSKDSHTRSGKNCEYTESIRRKDYLGSL